MVRNEEIYKQAIIFRKRGFTYVEIAKICGVSKSTVSNWCKDKRFSKAVYKENAARAARDNSKRLQLMNKARSAERTARYAEAVRSASTEYQHYKDDPLFVAGLMLYIGEGDNKGRIKIRLANANMDVQRIFILFLKTYLGVPKERIRFWILLYPDHNEVVCVRAWSRKLRLTPDNYYKNQVIVGKSKKRTLQYGVGNTIISDTVLKHKLNRWIELALKEL